MIMLQFVDSENGQPILINPVNIVVVRIEGELVEITTDCAGVYNVDDSIDSVVEQINAARYVLHSGEILTAKVLATVDQIEEVFSSITPEQWEAVNEYITEMSKFVNTNL